MSTDYDAFDKLLLHHLVPGLGAIIACLMFASPMQAVLKAKRTGIIGQLNPLPLVAIIANCVGWLIYGAMNSDPYVMAANYPGLLMGIFMVMVTYALASPETRDSVINALLFFAFVISSACIYISLFVPSDQGSLYAGYLAVFILLIYYASPLSVVFKVLATRNSASLHWPLSIMSVINGSLWVAYGLGVKDVFIYGPNGVGVVLGFFQILLVLIFPCEESYEPADEYFDVEREDSS